MDTYIYFIRHGITEGLEKNWFYGAIDIPVTENGFKELLKLKESGIYPEFEKDDVKFYTSGMLRANQTLNTIYGDVPYTVISNLREIDFGDWEGKTITDLEDEKAWNDWMNDTTGEFAFPNGESKKDYWARMKKGREELLKLHKESGVTNTVMVFHGGSTSTTMLDWFKDENKYFYEWTPGPGRGYKIYVNSDNIPYKYERI